MNKWPLGVFTSIDAGLGVDLEVAHELGMTTIQMHAPHPGTRTQTMADEILKRMDKYGLTITAVFGGFDGESYADIPTVAETVGLVPESTRASRLKEMKEISDFASMINCNVIALHLGFVPHDTDSQSYKDIVKVTKELCDYAADNQQSVHLETGQETAEDLIQFIDDTGSDNLFVNFDPANMILYGTGQPIEALEMIGERVRSCHFKDGKWSDAPGKEWGEETMLGEGDVNIESYLQTLDKIGYTGPLTIEREIPKESDRQKIEIGHAVGLLKELKAKLESAV